MVVGDLEITALADIEVGAAVVHDLLAVEPRLEEAVRAGRPLHVIDEVVPDVLGDRADRDAVVAGIARAVDGVGAARHMRSEEHTSELQSQSNLVCRLLLEKKKKI